MLLYTRTAGPRHAHLGPALPAGLNPPLTPAHVLQNALIAWLGEVGVAVDWTEDVTLMWYNWMPFPTRVEFLLAVDESTLATRSTVHPGHGAFHPISWCQYYDGGRAFITALGHDSAAWTDGSGYTRTTPRSAASTTATSAASAAPGSTGSRAASPPAPTRAPRSRSTACSTSSPRWATCSRSTARPASTKWVYRQTRGTRDPPRRRGRRRQGLHPRPRQLDHRARPGDRRGRVGEADQRLRQHGEGRRHPLRRPALRRHPRRRPGRRAGAQTPPTATCVWHFWGAPGPGEFGNDTWEGELLADRRRHAVDASGARPRARPGLLDLRQRPRQPVLTGRFRSAAARTCSPARSSRWTCRPAQYRWHFQSIHHGIWDMDNVMAPVLADARIRGRLRKLVVYGSKSGMYFILDRTDGSAPLGIDERPGARRSRARRPGRPSRSRARARWTEHRVVDQPLGTSVPGDPNRAVPNYVQGALYDPHWDIPVLSIPGHGGGADWNHQSYSHRTGLIYTGYGYVAAAHSLTEASNGLRPPGEYQTGGIVAVDPSARTGSGGRSRCRTRWRTATASSPPRATCCSSASRTATCSRWTPATATSCGGSRPGRRSAAARSCYEVDGEQYLAVYAGGTSIPYGDSAPARRLPVGVQARRHACAPAPTPAAAGGPPAGLRRPGRGQRRSTTPSCSARTYNAATGTVGTTESTAVNAMAPTHLRVPVGTTVTFINPGGQRQRARRDAVLRGAVRRPAAVRASPSLHLPRAGASTSSTTRSSPGPRERSRSTEARPGSAARPGSPAGRTPAPQSGPRGSGWGSPAHTGSRPVTPRGSRAR